MVISEIRPNITAPNDGALRTRTFRFLLDQVLKFPPSTKFVDLGAGPCLFSKIVNERGYDVTAVDGRTVRVPDDLGAIKFVHSNVNEFDLSGFDVILCLGLLYHLTLEDQVKLLSRCPDGSTLILDTQVHIPELVVEKASTKRKFSTQNVQGVGSYEGVIFPEEDNPMASIGNHVSWWHTEPSLLKMLGDVGFKSVAKIEPAYVSKYGGRKWYVCRRTPGEITMPAGAVN